MTVANRLRRSVSGSIELDLPGGLSLEGPVGFGPLAGHASVDVTFTLRAATNAPPGSRRVPYRFRYRVSGGEPQVTPYGPLPLHVGPVLDFDYSSRSDPRYRVRTSRYTAEAMMQHGLLVKLAGPDGAVVLDNQPLFTIADQGKLLLRPDQKSAYVWARPAPAWMRAHLENLVYYTLDGLEDRMRVGVDREWNRVKEMQFALPGRYAAPGGNPAWKRIVTVDANGQESDAAPARGLRTAAAELELPGLPYSLAFEFQPPLVVDFDGPAMQFTFNGYSDDGWTFGFCPTGKLAAWRQAGKAR
jgi:hypothetical protein